MAVQTPKDKLNKLAGITTPEKSKYPAEVGIIDKSLGEKYQLRTTSPEQPQEKVLKNYLKGDFKSLNIDDKDYLIYQICRKLGLIPRSMPYDLTKIKKVV